MVALTKCDKLNKTDYRTMFEQLAVQLEAYRPEQIIPFSAVSGVGVQELRTAIEQAVE